MIDPFAFRKSLREAWVIAKAIEGGSGLVGCAIEKLYQKSMDVCFIIIGKW